ncbi:MAG: rod shape-determining protein MreD [Oscillospiraceae bacterium]|nr:rod shape-determining protein MreD [Oscillospiraceae bacterium]
MNIDLKRKKEKRNTVIRWILYGLLTVISYIYMTTAPQKQFMLRTPLFVIPAAMCIAMFEEPFDSALMGCAAGLLLDTAQGTLIGLSGIIMMWCCLAASLLFHFFMRRHILNIIALNAAAVIVQGTVHYFFYYAIWEYDSAGKIFTGEFLPVMIYTSIAAVPFFFIVRFLSRHLGLIDESYIEEKSDDIVRE